MKKPSETNNDRPRPQKSALGDLRVALLKLQIKLNGSKTRRRDFNRLQSESAATENSRDARETLQTMGGGGEEKYQRNNKRNVASPVKR